MKKQIIPTALDTLLVFTATAAATFTALRYYLKILWLSAALAAFIGFATATLFFVISYGKITRSAMSSRDAEQMARLLDTLCVLSADELSAYFKRLLRNAGVGTYEDNGTLVLRNINAELRYYFTFSEVTEGKIVEFYKQTKAGRNVLVVGRGFDERTKKLSARFAGRIMLADGATLYRAAKKYDVFPSELLNLKEPEREKLVLKEVFCKKRAKRYLLYGLTLEFFSFFVFYPVYYIFFGGAMIMLSVICFFFGNAPSQEKFNPFNV